MVHTSATSRFAVELEKFVHHHIPNAPLASRILDITTRHVVSSQDTIDIDMPHIPLLVLTLAQELKLSTEVAHALARCHVIYYAAADRAEDMANGEVSEGQTGQAVNDICLLHFLYQQAIRAIPVSLEHQHSLYHLFSRMGVVMTLGQNDDLETIGRLERVDTVAIARRKAGAEAAAFFGAPALLANVDPQPWIDFGISFGTVVQLLNDYVDVFLDPDGKDWAEGKLTLPIVSGLYHPQYGRPLLALWHSDRCNADYQSAARWYLCQADVDDELKSLAQQEIKQMSRALAKFKRPSCLIKAIEQLQEAVDGLSQAMAEFRNCDRPQTAIHAAY